MTHKIAIITTGYQCVDQYGDDYRRVVESITDWEEVSDEDFKCLKSMEGRLEFAVIERPVDTRSFVKKTVADYKAYAKAEEKRLEEEKRKREEKARERKFKKELKDKESKKALLEKLKAELGEE